MTYASTGEPGTHVELTRCANCGHSVAGSYCARCGQKATTLNPTLRELVTEFAHELLDLDGRIFRSVRLLFTRPGFLTREHFEGRRARYVSPIRLYLIFSVAFFAVFALGVEISPFDEQETAELQQLAGTRPDQVIQRMWEWAPRTMFVLVPVFALIVSGVTRSAGRNYPQDVYFALHIHAATFGVLALGTALKFWDNDLVALVVDSAGMTYLFWYGVAAFRNAYGGSWRRALARAAVAWAAYLIAVVVAITVISLGAVFV